ncbi:aldo/keto reductase [Parvularcula flava]|uniref:Aldo/keto reductase n=1 Tax=Aquisalinus luteolus TaxID=1566827 RepID=A0A8J3A061_9PROT|nr:aldo/keto reductase [Aquisalinus luteolus]NHK26472.1 aldo/keto reductase [Aquisalinus luteolus]GGH92436.1 oxidoreductase [Aquisalinus luteolus]
MLDLPKRQIGKTDLHLPVLGFGAAPLGNLYRAISDDDAQAVLDTALDKGFCYFDTAPHYGFGLSERRLGKALAASKHASSIILSTKVGRRLEPVSGDVPAIRHGFIEADPYEPVFDYSYDAVMRSFEESCARLRRDHIDILYAHDLGRMTHGERHEQHLKTFLEGGLRAMEELRSTGRVTAIGIGANEWEIGADVLGHADLDCFLLAGRYTLLEQGAIDDFLTRAEKRKVSVIVGGPFNSGILAADLEDDNLPYNYEQAPAPVIERSRRIKQVCNAHDVRITAAALQFPLAHPAVTSIIPGLANIEEVTQAYDDIRAAIDGSLWTDLKREGLIATAAPVPGKGLEAA